MDNERKIKEQAILSQIAGTFYDFLREYAILRTNILRGKDANDHYHHSMANCRATQRGQIAKMLAEVISDLKEMWDLGVKRNPFYDSLDDQIANFWGRTPIEGNNPEERCKRFDIFNGGSKIDSRKYLKVEKLDLEPSGSLKEKMALLKSLAEKYWTNNS